jgi:hypothetical protein
MQSKRGASTISMRRACFGKRYAFARIILMLGVEARDGVLAEI